MGVLSLTQLFTKPGFQRKVDHGSERLGYCRFIDMLTSRLTTSG